MQNSMASMALGAAAILLQALFFLLEWNPARRVISNIRRELWKRFEHELDDFGHDFGKYA